MSSKGHQRRNQSAGRPRRECAKNYAGCCRKPDFKGVFKDE